MATLAPSAAAASADTTAAAAAAAADGGASSTSAADGGNEAFRTQARVEVLRRTLIARLRDRLRDTVHFSQPSVFFGRYSTPFTFWVFACHETLV